jgi:hypothetical protein
MSETSSEFRWRENVRALALTAVSSYERGHSGTGLHVDLAYNALELLDRLGHPGCKWADIKAFVASEQEYNVFMDAKADDEIRAAFVAGVTAHMRSEVDE